MNFIGNFIRKINIEEWVAIIVAIIASIVRLIFFGELGLMQSISAMINYVTFGEESFYSLFFIFLYFFSIGGVYIGIAKNLSDILVYKRPLQKGSWSIVLMGVFRPLRYFIPIVVVAAPLFSLLGSMSYSLRFSGEDLLFLSGDRFLFGYIPFIEWPTRFSNIFFDSFFLANYFSLSLVMSVVLILLFLFSRLEYRRAVLTFIFTLVISFPIFGVFPCQDPGNHFIRNIRGDDMPSFVGDALGSYNPSLIVREGIGEIVRSETDFANDNSVPISCFPSMHAVWAYLSAYYFSRIRRWTLFLSVPWVLSLLIGGVYLTQHYVVDYIVAIPVAILSVFIARILIFWEASWSWKKREFRKLSGENNNPIVMGLGIMKDFIKSKVGK